MKRQGTTSDQSCAGASTFKHEGKLSQRESPLWREVLALEESLHSTRCSSSVFTRASTVVIKTMITHTRPRTHTYKTRQDKQSWVNILQLGCSSHFGTGMEEGVCGGEQNNKQLKLKLKQLMATPTERKPSLATRPVHDSGSGSALLYGPRPAPSPSGA